MTAKDLFDALSRLRILCGDDAEAYEKCKALLEEHVRGGPAEAPEEGEEGDEDEEDE